MDAKTARWAASVDRRLAILEGGGPGGARPSDDKGDRFRLIRKLQSATDKMEVCQVSETVGEPFDVV